MLDRLFGRGKSASDAIVPVPELSVLLADIARPLPDPAPCGNDSAYDAEFMRLKDEIDKLNGVDQRIVRDGAVPLSNGNGALQGGGLASVPGFNPDLVVMLAHGILRERSKDLRVVGYLALGLARRDGLHGVAQGLGALRILVDSFWEGLFPLPTRMKGRFNAIETCLGWLASSIEPGKATPEDKEQLEEALDHVLHLEEVAAGWNSEGVTERLTGVARALREALERCNRAGMAPVVSRTAPSPAPHVATNGAGLTGEVSAPPAEMHNPSPPSPSGQPLDDVLRAAGELLRADKHPALPYRLARVCRWDVLASEPPSDRHKTRIEAPPAARRTYLAALHTRQEWSTLLDAAESSFSQSPFHFWLDLQRYTVDALEASGADFAAARDAIVREIRALLVRLPGIATLTFADGTAFANPATALWLDELAQRGSSVPAPRTANVPTESDQFSEARTRLAGGDFGGALALLQRASGKDTSQRQHFVRRSFMASICLDAGQLAIARALLDELAESVEQYRLEQWDPELALTVWTRQYACYSALATRAGRQGDSEGIGTLLERVFGKICRVDSTRALGLAQEVRRPM